MKRQRSKVVHLVEDHLVLEGSDGSRQASIRKTKSNFKQRIILRILYQKHNDDEIYKVAKISHVVVPALAFVVCPFSHDHRGHFQTMIIINEAVFVAPKDKNVNDELEDSIDESGFVGSSGERSGLQVLGKLGLLLVVSAKKLLSLFLNVFF